jgi:hypothetical protein
MKRGNMNRKELMKGMNRSNKEMILGLISDITSHNTRANGLGSRYEFTRSEVLSPDSHRPYNRVRAAAAVSTGVSGVSMFGTFIDLVILDFQTAAIWGGTALITGAVSSVLYGRTLPRINAKLWAKGVNALLKDVMLSTNVSVTEREIQQSLVVKEIGGGGQVTIRAKKGRARLAAPQEIVGSVEIRYPNEQTQDFDAVFDSVQASDPDVAKAISAAEKKQLKSGQKNDLPNSKRGF